ncbi:MAG: ribbon-helix-helix domain-containing protein [Deinococcus sp.]|nr:ribbon-helix-helix domain-containing protein [Deinococcus sp.]
MTYQNAQRVTASLPPNLATFLDEYQKRTGVSKSEIIALGLKSLQEKLLAEEYAAYAQSGEFADLETGDGLDDESDQWR